MICAECNATLTPAEITEPIATGNGIVCSTCECDLLHFTCCWCGNCGKEADQERYVMVFDAAAADVALPGLYRIDALPYVNYGLIGGGSLCPWNLTWLGFLAALRTDDERAPCGHLCADCQVRALHELTYETRCGAAALLAP